MINCNITSREMDILLFVDGYQKEHGYSPTYREIGEGIGTKSKNQVRNKLVSLTDKGAIKMSERICRSIVIKKGVITNDIK